MSRYRQNKPPLDDSPLSDGDDGFMKFASRRQSAVLEPGTLEYSENMRLDRTTAIPRKGIFPAVTDLSLVNPPVIFTYQFAFDVAVASITRAASVATVTTAIPHGYTPGTRVNIRGAVEPEYNDDHNIVITSPTTFDYTVAGAPATPATGTIFANNGPVFYETYDDEVRTSCKFATNDTTRTEYIIQALTNYAYAIRPGTASTKLLYPMGETVDADDDCSMLYWNGRVFLFRGYQTAPPVVIVSITQVGGTATVTTSVAHGYATGDWVYVEEVVPVGYWGIQQVTVTSATTFEYPCDPALVTPAVVDPTASKVRSCKRPLYWNGDFTTNFVAVDTGASPLVGTFIRMPPVPWAVDFNGRLSLPIKADQMIFSDPYDSDTYDTIYTQFRIHYGSSDKIGAAIGTPGGVEFILGVQSLSRIILDGTGLGIGSTQDVTSEAGILARRSLRMAGPFVLWLDKNGVRRAQMTSELNLLVETVPLTDDVTNYIERINGAAMSKVTATFWNNRYYIALPLDGNTRATQVLIYNFLNEGWETIDTFPSGFDVQEFHQMDYNGVKRLYVTTTYGSAYVMEETTTGDQWVNSAVPTTYPVIGTFFTRYYMGGTREIKRCRRMDLEANLGIADAFTAYARARNPDRSGDTNNVTASATNDGVYPIYAGLSASAAQLRVATTAGRPEFRAVLTDFTGVRERSYVPKL
jgi:hypothetical protein